MKPGYILFFLFLAGTLCAKPENPDQSLGTVQSLRDAVNDLIETFGDRYPGGGDYLNRLEKVQKTGDPAALEKLRAEALLANPLLDCDGLMVVRRSARTQKLGLPQNWQGNCALRRDGYDDSIAVLDPTGKDSKPRTIFKPEKDLMVADVDLHWNGDRFLFSMVGSHGRWQIWEMKTDGSGPRQVTPGTENDVDNYDACYLPDGRIVFASTRCFHGVPCVGGKNAVANLFIMNDDGSGIRQLCFDQDHNWCPTVLNDGRVLYSRWEYSDTPHYFTRVLFNMKPDGTGQMQYYGSNSYWPNSLFYARPLPGSTSKVAGIVSGHHGVPRMGELVILDAAEGRHEADGAVQRIPGRGEPVPATIQDRLVDSSWPKFLHPWPLSEKHLLVACQMDKNSPWGIYLVDVFDNFVPIAQDPEYALLEPVPLTERPIPPIIPDRVKPDMKDAFVHITDIYNGDGLKDVPRGAVKSLRVVEPHYAYNQQGGHINIGIDGSWDVKRIHGTVPVSSDGSASFKVPANTPLFLQPLDEEGAALQVMRSWFTAMPGEVASCAGCHEDQNSATPNTAAASQHRTPVTIESWHGPARGFSFKREVQPVLDQYCVSCHDGAEAQPDFRSGLVEQDLSKKKKDPKKKQQKKKLQKFTSGYVALHPFVRRPGPESDYHMLNPMEYHASTSELIQILRKGHHGVELAPESWDRLITWIDLNVPDHGTWSEQAGNKPSPYQQRRLDMRSRFANRSEDPEAIWTPDHAPAPPVTPKKIAARPPLKPATVDGWPFSEADAQLLQKEAASRLGGQDECRIDLGDGIEMEMILIPSGRFVMGSDDRHQDESPAHVVEIHKPFFMGKCEVTNTQYARFDPDHDSGFVSRYNKDQSTRGEPVNGPEQPVIRISWKEAGNSAARLSGKTGKRVFLPTEAQWEWACRAGSAAPLSFGDVSDDFGPFANLADVNLNNLTIRNSPDWIPYVPAVNDKTTATAAVGHYQPNAWGLHDMHGNVSEWTRSTPHAYPYANDGRNNTDDIESERVLRGGSYYDRPHRARSAFRLAFPSWQKVYNAGFRVMIEVDVETLRKVAAMNRARK